VETKKPIVVKYGLNHVTYLIEQVCGLLWLHTLLRLLQWGFEFLGLESVQNLGWICR
jgi:hypothetical protein